MKTKAEPRYIQLGGCDNCHVNEPITVYRGMGLEEGLGELFDRARMCVIYGCCEVTRVQREPDGVGITSPMVSNTRRRNRSLTLEYDGTSLQIFFKGYSIFNPHHPQNPCERDIIFLDVGKLEHMLRTGGIEPT